MLGFLALTIAAAGGHSTLTITPAVHDFGQVIVGAQGTTFSFKVTMPPGADSIRTLYGSTDSLDFRDYFIMQNQACSIDSLRRDRTCYFSVEFVPQALGPRRGTVQVFDNRGNSGTAILTGTGIFGCTMYEGWCSYGAFYSGTVSWSSALTIQQGAVGSSGPRRTGTWSNDMTVTVTNGQATCQGSSVRDEKEYEGSRLDRSKRATGVVSGPGIIVVEFKRQNVPRITVACPSATVTETTTDYLSNQTGTGTSNAKPVNWRDRISIDPAPASAIGVDLVGNKAVPHPEEDPLNGVTGRMTLTWSLRRN